MGVWDRATKTCHCGADMAVCKDGYEDGSVIETSICYGCGWVGRAVVRPPRKELVENLVECWEAIEPISDWEKRVMLLSLTYEEETDEPAPTKKPKKPFSELVIKYELE